LMWDGGDRQMNLWLSTLIGPVLLSQDSLYRVLPGPPYDQAAVDALDSYLIQYPSARVAAMWFRPVSQEALAPIARQRGEYFLQLVQVPLRQSGLCPECPA